MMKGGKVEKVRVYLYTDMPKQKAKKIILHYYSILRSSHALDKDSIKFNSMGWVEREYSHFHRNHPPTG